MQKGLAVSVCFLATVAITLAAAGEKEQSERIPAYPEVGAVCNVNVSENGTTGQSWTGRILKRNDDWLTVLVQTGGNGRVAWIHVDKVANVTLVDPPISAGVIPSRNCVSTPCVSGAFVEH